MTLADIPGGQAVFVDANLFVYAFAPDPVLGPPSAQLLERIERHDVQGFTSSDVLCDVAHRLMSLEACAVFGWPYARIAQRMKSHPTEVQQLRRYRQAIDEVLAIGVQILPVFPRHVLAGTDVSRQSGLLMRDAVLVAVMRENGLTRLASHDGDFDRVPGIVRYAPV
jgi:predicted nucleic acid-binding protein